MNRNYNPVFALAMGLSPLRERVVDSHPRPEGCPGPNFAQCTDCPETGPCPIEGDAGVKALSDFGNEVESAVADFSGKGGSNG